MTLTRRSFLEDAARWQLVVERGCADWHDEPGTEVPKHSKENGGVPNERPEFPEDEDQTESDGAVHGDSVMPDYSKLLARSVMPDYSKLLARSVMPDYSKLLARSVMPDYSEALRRLIAPRFASNILLSLQAKQSSAQIAGYQAAADALFTTLGLGDATGVASLEARPTTDDTAFRAIAEASAATAAAISIAADKAGNPLLPAHIIRNMLAWLVVSLIVVAYVGGTILFPPWGPVVGALLSASGLTAPAAYEKISQPPGEDEE